MLGHPFFALGKYDEAIEHYQQSIRLEPRHISGYHMIALAHEAKHEFMEAIDEDERGTRIEGKNSAETTRHYGELREAVRLGGARGYHLKALQAATNASRPDPYEIATAYASLGEKERAYNWLQRAVDQHSDLNADHEFALMFDPCWDHNDEQFKAIARNMGLMQ